MTTDQQAPLLLPCSKSGELTEDPSNYHMYLTYLIIMEDPSSGFRVSSRLAQHISGAKIEPIRHENQAFRGYGAISQRLDLPN